VRLATWNVNSVRARADRVIAFLERTGTDVLAIQETKCRDDQFPYLLFEAAGYEVAHVGFSQWNGVAVASRVGIDDVELAFAGQPGFARSTPEAAGVEDAPDPVHEARALGATCGGVRVWSLYVPNGRALADPHYTYKLAWLEALRGEAARWLDADPAAQVALVGDWNIAPLDTDVWDISLFDGATHVSAAERAAFAAFADAGYTEVSRPLSRRPIMRRMK
jgi:exodeoxyribonuclease-3